MINERITKAAEELIVVQQISNGFILDNEYTRTPIGILKMIAEKFYAPKDNNGGEWEMVIDIRYTNSKGKFTTAVQREKLK